MNTAEWIIVGILSGTLLLFLILGIIVLIKTIKLINQTQRFVEKGEQFADTANGIASNLVDMSFVGGISGLVRRIVKGYNNNKKKD